MNIQINNIHFIYFVTKLNATLYNFFNHSKYVKKKEIKKSQGQLFKGFIASVISFQLEKP